jgi:anti-sigma factor RsiW
MMERKQTLETACRDFEEDLVIYYYGDGSERERSRVEVHVQSCARCHRFLDDLRRLLPQVAQPESLPQSFWDGYYRETVAKITAQRERSPWWRNLLTLMQSWAVPVFATASVAVLAVGLLIGKGGWSPQAVRPRANIPQEILSDASQLEFFNSMDMIESLPVLEALDGSKTEPFAGRNG